jgi:hypothetical protein
VRLLEQQNSYHPGHRMLGREKAKVLAQAQGLNLLKMPN